MYICNKCSGDKFLFEMHHLQRHTCKVCVAATRCEMRLKKKGLDPVAYREKAAANSKAWKLKNQEKYLETRRLYNLAKAEVNRKSVAKHTAKFKLERPEEYAAKNGEKTMRREAAKIQRTPVWSCPQECRVVYREREEKQQTSGIRHAVDHSVPLRGKLVSGFHVPENLVAIPFEMNASKGNRFDPMTYEWWPECCPRPLEKSFQDT